MDFAHSVALTIPVPQELVKHGISDLSLLDLEIPAEDLAEWEEKDLNEELAAEVAVRGTVMKLLRDHLDLFGVPTLTDYFDSPLAYVYEGIEEGVAEQETVLEIIVKLEDNLRNSLHTAAVLSGIRILH
tara:strand:- start:183 stop:569 length:387 start_codon:yes stop_codon:yes gene_type:complete